MVGDELRVTITAREIYEEIVSMRAEIKSALEGTSSLKNRVGRLETIVYGLVPIMTILGGLVGKFWL